jgi:UDP-glucose 4-epimerase
VIAEIFKKENPDVVNHHAAQISVTESQKDPLENEKVNVTGTFNLVTQPGIKRFIFASTGGAMFSNPESFPATEEMIAHPISNYGISKLMAENTIRDNARTGKFPYVILRYANVFGPRQNAHGESGVMAIFSSLASTNKKPTIYGKTTTRDYVYVTDVVRANLLALDKGDNEIIHIATQKETTNQEVYEAVAKEFNWKQEPEYQSLRSGEVVRSVLANKKAKQMLGWTPEVSVEQGLHAIHQSLHES